jgi:hypothetical protein
MSGQFLSAEIEQCLHSGHRFVIAGSDKTPMKKSLICRTCTDRNPGKTVYVAYGIDTAGWGEWYTMRVHTSELVDE